MSGESYWTYQAGSPTPSYAEAVASGAIDGERWTEKQWQSFTPGMRREIVRSAAKSKSKAQQAELA